MMNLTDKIYVAGHRGLVGSAIVRALEKKSFFEPDVAKPVDNRTAN